MAISILACVKLSTTPPSDKVMNAIEDLCDQSFEDGSSNPHTILSFAGESKLKKFLEVTGSELVCKVIDRYNPVEE